MPSSPGIVDRLAALLEYPTASFAALLGECRAQTAGLTPEAAAGLERFAAGIAARSTRELQEDYTATFDLDPDCSMDVGWHLFGDRFERGAFLAELRPRLAAAGIDERFELPDHLPRVLQLLDRSERSATAELQAMVGSAVGKLRAALGKRGSPYEHLVTCAFMTATRGV